MSENDLAAAIAFPGFPSIFSIRDLEALNVYTNASSGITTTDTICMVPSAQMIHAYRAIVTRVPDCILVTF